MGEAKRRGTYEQRKAEGQVRRNKLQNIRAEKIALREEAITHQERHAARMFIAQIEGLLSGLK